MNKQLFPRAFRWNRRVRIGSCIPCGDVDPYTGSFMTYGIIIGRVNGENSCSRKDATGALIELVTDVPRLRIPWGVMDRGACMGIRPPW